MTTDLQQKEQTNLTNSEKFTARIMREFQGNIGQVEITEYQRQLIHGYFINIDRALKNAETKRYAAKNDLPYNWGNINMNDLALDLINCAKMGLDMGLEAHLYPIPYKNNKTNKYDITLMKGYNGIQYIAERYALEKPKAVTVELVFSTDTFKPIKKSKGNNVEDYEFDITNPFDRGEVIGGFGYIEYTDPAKNKLVIMSLKEILKRKPKYASAEFWGGTKKVWESGKQREEETDGWFEQMCLKTLKREVYSAKHIPRDPRKIDEAYQHMLSREKVQELEIAAMEVQQEAANNANRILIEDLAVADAEIVTDELPPANVDTETGEIMERPELVDEPADYCTSDIAEGPAF